MPYKAIYDLLRIIKSTSLVRSIDLMSHSRKCGFVSHLALEFYSHQDIVLQLTIGLQQFYNLSTIH